MKLSHIIPSAVCGFFIGMFGITALTDHTPQQEQIVKVLSVTPLQVIKSKKVSVDADELACLSKNIYHEAGVEDFFGKITVAQVTLNRIGKRSWGDSICGVVYKKSQFSWTLKQSLVNEKPKGQLWKQSQEVAYSILAHGVRDESLKDALFYHTDYIKKPKWASKEYLITQVGRHLVYANDKKA